MFCQVGNGDLDDFFRHENQRFPPSLSQFGKLRSGTKFDLLSCLGKQTPSGGDIPSVDVLLLDGAAIINMLKPGASRTYQYYVDGIFLPYVNNKLQSVNRVDIVWDEYLPDSLKSMTRTKRGKGVIRRVQPDTRLPSN